MKPLPHAQPLLYHLVPDTSICWAKCHEHGLVINEGQTTQIVGMLRVIFTSPSYPSLKDDICLKAPPTSTIKSTIKSTINQPGVCPPSSVSEQVWEPGVEEAEPLATWILHRCGLNQTIKVSPTLTRSLQHSEDAQPSLKFLPPGRHYGRFIDVRHMFQPVNEKCASDKPFRNGDMAISMWIELLKRLR